MAKIFIDAEKAIYGRICSYAAKQALEGNEIVIVNCEKVIISGNKRDVIERYSKLRKLGGFSQNGPKRSRLNVEMFKRSIRGMLPDFRWGEGKDALDRIKCYEGIPKEFEKEKFIKLFKLHHDKYIELKELSKSI